MSPDASPRGRRRSDDRLVTVISGWLEMVARATLETLALAG